MHLDQESEDDRSDGRQRPFDRSSLFLVPPSVALMTQNMHMAHPVARTPPWMIMTFFSTALIMSACVVYIVTLLKMDTSSAPMKAYPALTACSINHGECTHNSKCISSKCVCDEGLVFIDGACLRNSVNCKNCPQGTSCNVLTMECQCWPDYNMSSGTCVKKANACQFCGESSCQDNKCSCTEPLKPLRMLPACLDGDCINQKVLIGSHKCESTYKPLPFMARLLSRVSLSVAADPEKQTNLGILWSAIVVEGLVRTAKVSSDCAAVIFQADIGGDTELCWRQALQLLEPFKNSRSRLPFRGYADVSRVSNFDTKELFDFCTHAANASCYNIGSATPAEERKLFKIVRNLYLVNNVISFVHNYPYAVQSLTSAINAVASHYPEGFKAVFFCILTDSKYFSNLISLVNKNIYQKGKGKAGFSSFEKMSDKVIFPVPLKNFVEVKKHIDRIKENLKQKITIDWWRKTRVLPELYLYTRQFWEKAGEIKLIFNPFLVTPLTENVGNFVQPKFDRTIRSEFVLPMGFLFYCEDIWSKKCAAFITATVAAPLAKTNILQGSSVQGCSLQASVIGQACEMGIYLVMKTRGYLLPPPDYWPLRLALLEYANKTEESRSEFQHFQPNCPKATHVSACDPTV